MFIFYLCLFFLGASLASFLTAYIHLRTSLFSHCDHCNHRLYALDLIPILSYIFFMGKCRYCFKRISFIYFVTEFIFGCFVLFLYHYYGLSFYFFIMFIVGSICFYQSVVDIYYQEVNIIYFIPLIFLVFLFHLPFIYRFFGALFPIIFFIINKVYKECLGEADIIFMMIIGYCFGLINLMMLLFLASIIALIIAGLLKVLKKRFKTLPFLPMLSISLLVITFYGARIFTLLTYIWYT